MSKNRQIRQQGTQNEVVIVKVMIELPELVYDSYAESAMKGNRDVEDVISQRLVRCKDISGTGIYFDETAKKRLANVLGHTVSDSEGALQRLETTTAVDVSGFQFELDPRLIQRLKTRVHRGENYEDVMYRELVRGLMTFAGMSPPMSNTGGWWRRGLKKGSEPLQKPATPPTASTIAINIIPKEISDAKVNPTVIR